MVVPPVASERVTDDSAHRLMVPVMAAGCGLTVTRMLPPASRPSARICRNPMNGVGPAWAGCADAR